jgi:hypothetical protein
MHKEFENIKNVDQLINALQFLRNQYGNIHVNIDLSIRKDEGCYDIDAVFYGYDEENNQFISLISW